MFNIWTPVKVKTEGHPRFGQAGTVQAIDPKQSDSVGVKFDQDGVIEVVQLADLQSIGY